jgi:hypothetical protein
MHPAPGYLLCRESPVETTEEQRASGLIVKHELDMYESAIQRGIVVEVGVGHPIVASSIVEFIAPGNLVFYSVHYDIGEDFVVVNFNDVVAYDND